ncbi:TPA: hypothetical protein ACH3X2_012494 [Trebouxia sp. C0005]
MRRAAVTTSVKASAPDADAGSIFDMRASFAATKLQYLASDTGNLTSGCRKRYASN